MSSPKARVRPHIRVMSNKRRKSFSLSPSIPSSRSTSVVISPRKKRKVFLLSEDELSDHPTAPRQETPRSDPPAPPVKETARSNASDDDDFDAVAGSTISHEAPDLVFYGVQPDEIAEDDNLQIIGETDPADLSADSDDEHGDIPVRLLTDFTIYEMETCDLVPVAELLQIQFNTSKIYGASGKVKPYVEEEDDDDDSIDDDDNSSLQGYRGKGDQIVKLSKIVEFDLHHVSSRQKKLDSKMYLRTKYAWYILDSPSAIYSTFFTGFWLQHRILHLVVTAATANRRVTFDDFIDSLKVTPATSDAIAVAIKILGRELTEEDVESDDVKSYLLVTLDELREQEGIKVGRVPLIRTLREGSDYFIDDTASSRSASRSLSPRKKSTVDVNPEHEVLKHRNPTVVTPLVSCIAKTLFERTLSVAGQLEKDDIENDVASDIGVDYMHHDDPDSIEWVEPADVDGYYLSVDMDGVVYSVGETVMVVPGQDTDHTRSKNAIAKTSQTTNTLGNAMWFCRICYMYEEDGEKLFHGQWYTHGSKTLLQETAHPQSLFLMDACEAGIPLASIFQKCNLRELVPGEDESTDENTENENNFYHGLTWIQQDSSMVELTQADIDSALAYCEDWKPCVSCGLERAKIFRTEFRPIPPRGFFQRGDKYHNDDFVYVIPSTDSSDMLYKIGQITKIKAMETPPKVVVRLFGRFDSVLRKMQKKGKLSVLMRSDNRRLFKTSDIIKVDANQIDGKCFVQHLTDSDAIDQWVQHDDHYFVNQCAESATTGSVQDLQMLAPVEFKFCPVCHEDRVQQLSNAKRLLERHGPLRGLELFSGAGGLGTGLDMSGFVETRWAVEFSPSAALTYQANHPEAIVYNQCSNVLLQHAIDSRDGNQRNALRSLHDGKTALPAMPKPGEVDFVYGGPPCQSFSGANHWKKANDIRSTLVCNMLSYVEFYRPSYFLLENVVGLLQYPLRGRMVGRAFVEGIKMGVVKFIVRTLTCLGYQVRFKVLQAGQYGAPQSRKRVLFWGAKRGLPLPDFPIPTHGFPKGSFYHTLATGAKLPPPSRSKDFDNLHMYAPLHAITVNDAIGDLPAFDWINPHQLCKSTADDKTESNYRLGELEIQQFDAVTKSKTDVNGSFSGFVDSEPYAHKPLNRYQKALRTHVKSYCVNYQYTRTFGAGIVERVTSIPLRANAYHDDLPRRLRMKSAIMDGGSRNFDGIFGRIDGDGYFRTAMTTVAPNAKGGTLLHPSQKRIVTVQECARAQGFPDHYQFLSINKNYSKIVEDQHRQIGNAVPCPLALALGKSLGQVLLKTWQESDRAGSPEV